MSTVSTRRRVRRVESVPVDEAARERAALLAAGLTQLLGTAARAVYEALQARPERLTSSSLPKIEREQVAALLDLRGAPAAVGQGARLEAGARAVLAASTAEEALQERLQLGALLNESRRQALGASLALCCREATLELGFTPLGAKEDGGLPLRVAAADAAGRAIVSEIRAEEDGSVTLESEVAGVTDGSCAGLMERFEKLLEEKGVRSAAPQRRPTGGVLETRAARAYAGSRLRTPAPGSRPVPVAGPASTGKAVGGAAPRRTIPVRTPQKVG